MIRQPSGVRHAEHDHSHSSKTGRTSAGRSALHELLDDRLGDLVTLEQLAFAKGRDGFDDRCSQPMMLTGSRRPGSPAKVSRTSFVLFSFIFIDNLRVGLFNCEISSSLCHTSSKYISADCLEENCILKENW